MATQSSDVIESFHASFMDKTENPEPLEQLWLKKAIAEYGTEICPLEYDEEIGEFAETLSQYVIDTIATMMKVMYLERTMSKYDKVASIVGKDLSVNGTNGLQKYTHEEYEKIKLDLSKRLYNLKPSAYN